VPARIEDILTSSLEQHTGPEAYPGDVAQVPDWPGAGPGRIGPINALSPLYMTDPLGFTRVRPKPPILWLRGAKDAIVSDTSLFDVNFLGQVGAIPGWRARRARLPSPWSQTARALQAYREAGGEAVEVVLDCGHTPYLERPEEFDAAFHAHLARAAARAEAGP
jgi:pimeloyl-ACP methyl ester carboxylesterase